MIARRITYKGNFNQDTLGMIYEVARRNEITGQVKMVNNNEIIMNLEGDPSFLKLVQHQVERTAKAYISGKNVEQIPYQRYVGLTLLS